MLGAVGFLIFLLTPNLLRNLLVKKFGKSVVKISQNYGHECVAPFLAHPVVIGHYCSVYMVHFTVSYFEENTA